MLRRRREDKNRPASYSGPSASSESYPAASTTPAASITHPPLPNTGDASGSVYTVGIIAEKTYTTADGDSIRFQVSGITSDNAAQWSLHPGDPGSLNASTCAVVTYNLPPANSISVDTTISITVKVGKASAMARMQHIAMTYEVNGSSPSNPSPATYSCFAI
jgi:hypothetical protein